MSLRTRIASIAAVAVAVSVVIVSLGIYIAAAHTLRGEVDRALVEQARDIGRRPGLAPGVRPGRFGGAGVFVQVLDGFGLPREAPSGVLLPVSEQAAAVAVTGGDALFETVTIDDSALRILTVAAPRGGAVQFARPTDEIEQSLGRLRSQLALAVLGGMLLATVLGLLVAERAVRPVDQLTRLAEEVAATQDLSRRIDAAGNDELGRLATTFNAMLSNLEQARHAQEQLVADASHELRTPLTSLRTNIEVLALSDRLDEQQRHALINDVVGQLEEFGTLVSGLVELARGAQPVRAATAVQLDALVERAVNAARTHATEATSITLHAQPSTVLAEEDRLLRAISNLLDNAIKYGEGSAVEVSVGHGTVIVRDHGPGINEAHLAHVFDRFYRAPDTRGAPGSGLGLSIVRQVAEAHGGSVTVQNASGGGAEFTLRLPMMAPTTS